jgi:hypothetical protein
MPVGQGFEAVKTVSTLCSRAFAEDLARRCQADPVGFANSTVRKPEIYTLSDVVGGVDRLFC